MNTGPACGYPGAPDEAMGGPHQCDDNPTLYISVCPGVGLSPLGSKVDG